MRDFPCFKMAFIRSRILLRVGVKACFLIAAAPGEYIYVTQHIIPDNNVVLA
jgi:hypothetical protein